MVKRLCVFVLIWAVASVSCACGIMPSDAEVKLKSDNTQIQDNIYDSSLERVKESGVLKVGINGKNEPFSFVGEDGNFVGYDIDLAKNTANLLGVKVEFVDIGSSDGGAQLENSEVDVLWSECKVVPEIEDKMLLSVPYAETNHIIVVKSSSDITSKEMLDSCKIGIQVGCSSEEYLKQDEIFSKLESRDILTFYDIKTALAYLRNDQMEALVLDELLYKYFSEDSQNQYAVLDDKLGKEEYAVAAEINSKELIFEIDSALMKLKENGTADKLHQKWFSNEN